jgi:dUTP pyrophosphatase
MNVKIKKLHPDAVIPSYAKDGDAGMDLTVVNEPSVDSVNVYGTIKYDFGIAVEIPKGYVGLIFPRSSVYKSPTRLANAVGVIDSGYRGELSAQFDVALPAYFASESGNDDYEAKMYEKGDRAAQLLILPYPEIEFEEVEDLSETERGEGGFGSSNK